MTSKGADNGCSALAQNEEYVMKAQTLLACIVVIGLSQNAEAGPITFETLSDSEVLTNQFAGLLFSNAVGLTAGLSLNEAEAPPKSGFTVVGDEGAPLSILFTKPVDLVSAYFTYQSALTLRAFDSSNALLGTVSSAFSNNLFFSGDPGSNPNEFLQLALSGISAITITGEPTGFSFVMDDLTFNPTAAVPDEASAFILLLTGLGSVGTWRRRRKSRIDQHS